MDEDRRHSGRDTAEMTDLSIGLMNKVLKTDLKMKRKSAKSSENQKSKDDCC